MEKRKKKKKKKTKKQHAKTPLLAPDARERSEQQPLGFGLGGPFLGRPGLRLCGCALCPLVLLQLLLQPESQLQHTWY